MKLDTSQWHGFRVGSILEIRNGRGITVEEVTENPGDLNAVQSGEERNGILGRISEDYCREMGYIYTREMCLTVARTGTAGYVSFQDSGCVVGDSAKLLLLRHKPSSAEIYLFLQTVLSQNRFKYSYGRKVTEKKYIEDIIDLPILRDGVGEAVLDPAKTFDENGFIPDWQFMERFVRALYYKPISTINTPAEGESLDVDRFAEFTFGQLVSDVYKAKAHNKDDLTQVPYTQLDTVETVRYVTRTAENNGCEMLVQRDDLLEPGIEVGNAISIGDTTATSFYQEKDFVAGDHMVVVRADWLNPFTGNYVTTLLNRESYRYSYGRAFIMSAIKGTVLRLPVVRNKEGAPLIDPMREFHEDGFVPDWKFMEDYMRSLPYGDRIPAGE